MIFAPRDTHNAGVEDGEASTAKLRRFLGVVIPVVAVGYIALVGFDFDARWPNGIALEDVAADSGLLAGVDSKTGVTTLTSYENGERCARLSPRAQTQIASIGAKPGAVYDVRISTIARLGRSNCKTSPIPFGRFYEVVSVNNAAVIGCAPDTFIARGQTCELPKLDPVAEAATPAPPVPAGEAEKPTNEADPPPAVPYRPFGAEPPPPVVGFDGENVSFEDFYPPSAIRLEQEGVVRVSVTHVANRGSISCTVLKSSGYSALDRQTCRLVGNHRLFTPSIAKVGARNNADSGNGEVTIVQGVRWVLPK
jgi:TonB family protein